MRQLLCAVLLLQACGHAWPQALVDDTGRAVALATPPQRVVSRAPSLTELVHAVGAGALLVAVDSGSDHPAAVRRLPQVGDALRLDVERIVALKPDVVLAWRHGTPGRDLAQVAALGVPVFQLEPRRLDDVPRAIERVGQLLHHGAEGRGAAAALRASRAALRAAQAGAAPVRVFVQIWRDPLLTLNDDHLIGDVLALCGGRNVFGAQSTLVPQVSLEAAAATDPEVLFTPHRQQRDGEGAVRAPQAADFAPWQRLASVAAVRRGWMYTLPGDTIARQGPRIDQGARAVCAALDEVRAERDAARPQR